MKMTPLEKRFVNRRRHTERNLDQVHRYLRQLDLHIVRDVLELGCGIGVVSASLAEKYGMNVQGTDFDPEQIEIALKVYSERDHLHFSIEDAAHLTFNDASFDLVLSQNVFHHVREWEAAVREVARVLRPGGCFIWLDFTYPKVIKRIFRPLVKNYGLYTTNDMKSAFMENGLALRSCERLHHGPFIYYGMLLQKS